MIILVLIFSYFLGSVPFGLVITRLAGMGDIRDIGSGNIGATNVLRTGRKDLALATLILDSGKGAIAVILTGLAFQWAELPVAAAGAGAFLGHCFPIWLRFKGGKGIATFLGTLLAMHFWVGLAACGAWLITALVFRFSSLAGLVAALTGPIVLIALDRYTLAIAALMMAAIVFYRHKANITRLLNGEEPKIGKKND